MKKHKKKKRRNPIAQTLRHYKPKIIGSKKRYKRKGKQHVERE